MAYLEELTGIEDLIPDWTMDGGGLHQTLRGGHLNIHADFTTHHVHENWARRVNILLYLNEEWHDDWGGKLELWDKDMTSLPGPRHARRATGCWCSPRRSTASTATPTGSTCPPDQARRSMALYYFTEEEAPVRRSTHYRARPEESRTRRAAIAADRVVLDVYDRVKRRLGLTDDAAQKVLGRFHSLARARPVTDTSTRDARSRRLSRPSRRQRLRQRLGVWRPERRPLLLLVVAAVVQSVVVLRLARRSWFGVDAVYLPDHPGPGPERRRGPVQARTAVTGRRSRCWSTAACSPRSACGPTCRTSRSRSRCTSRSSSSSTALLRSVGTHRWTTFGTCWLVLFFGAGSEAFMADAPMVLTAGLLLGLVAMLVMVRQRFSLRSRLIGGVLLLAAVMCSGTGLVAAVTVGVFLLLRIGVRAALVVGAPAVVAFSVWFFTIGRDGRVNVTGDRITEIPKFVWQGLTGSLGSLLGIPGTGAILLLALIVALVWPVIEAVALRQLALAGLVGAVTQLSLSSFASLVGGTAAARVGRYEYLVLVLLAAGIALGLETVRGLVEQDRLAPGCPRRPPGDRRPPPRRDHARGLVAGASTGGLRGGQRQALPHVGLRRDHGHRRR